MSEPLVTIGIPAFQKERHLRATLASALAQTHRELEIVIADNASTDRTVAIAREFAAADPRVRIVEHVRNLGSRRNFNLLFELARGDYFVWGRGHDLWHPEFVAAGVQRLQADPSLVLAHCACSEIDADDRDLGPVAEHLDTLGCDLPQRLAASWRHLLGPATLGVVRRSAMDRTNLFQDLAGCDVVFLLELAVQGAFAFDERPRLRLRRVRQEHSEAESVQRTWTQMNPHRVRREPPRLHMLEFLQAHLRVVHELSVPPHARDALLTDLADTFVARYGGSLEGAIDHVADAVERAQRRPAAAGDRIDAVTAMHWLAGLDAALFCRPDHERGQRARATLLRLCHDLTALPSP